MRPALPGRPALGANSGTVMDTARDMAERFHALPVACRQRRGISPIPLQRARSLSMSPAARVAFLHVADPRVRRGDHGRSPVLPCQHRASGCTPKPVSRSFCWNAPSSNARDRRRHQAVVLGRYLADRTDRSDAPQSQCHRAARIERTGAGLRTRPYRDDAACRRSRHRSLFRASRHPFPLSERCRRRRLIDRLPTNRRDTLFRYRRTHPWCAGTSPASIRSRTATISSWSRAGRWTRNSLGRCAISCMRSWCAGTSATKRGGDTAQRYSPLNQL